MTAVAVEVGYQNPRDRDHSWTERATGHRYWTFEVEIERVLSVETVAEAVFCADNQPNIAAEDTLVGKFQRAMIAAYERTTDRHHSLSIGDRVRIGEVEVVCANDGWERIYR